MAFATNDLIKNDRMYKPLKSSPRKLFLYSLLLIAFPAAAQDKGIHFEHALSWQQIKARANDFKALQTR
ncbi:hypothetical protein DF182_26060 [Chitinophaga flava]|uniref:Uncharacterized protein n=2 Tax=Chitinophaga flava TaxID=2259036 RepID=A0A365XUA6_9BACT|nr:hypothetical protein DF182_26060 [Chitinophaga flava]